MQPKVITKYRLIGSLIFLILVNTINVYSYTESWFLPDYYNLNGLSANQSIDKVTTKTTINPAATVTDLTPTNLKKKNNKGISFAMGKRFYFPRTIVQNLDFRNELEFSYYSDLKKHIPNAFGDTTYFDVKANPKSLMYNFFLESPKWIPRTVFSLGAGVGASTIAVETKLFDGTTVFVTNNKKQNKSKSKFTLNQNIKFAWSTIIAGQFEVTKNFRLNLELTRVNLGDVHYGTIDSSIPGFNIMTNVSSKKMVSNNVVFGVVYDV